MRWLRPSLILAGCLVAAGCRSPKKTVIVYPTAPSSGSSHTQYIRDHPESDHERWPAATAAASPESQGGATLLSPQPQTDAATRVLPRLEADSQAKPVSSTATAPSTNAPGAPSAQLPERRKNDHPAVPVVTANAIPQPPLRSTTPVAAAPNERQPPALPLFAYAGSAAKPDGTMLESALRPDKPGFRESAGVPGLAMPLPNRRNDRSADSVNTISLSQQQPAANAKSGARRSLPLPLFSNTASTPQVTGPSLETVVHSGGLNSRDAGSSPDLVVPQSAANDKTLRTTRGTINTASLAVPPAAGAPVAIKLLNPKRGGQRPGPATALSQITVNKNGEAVLVPPSPGLGVWLSGGDLLWPFGGEFLTAGVTPWLEDEDLASQWREAQLARQASEQKAREVERENLSRTLYRFLLGKQVDSGKN